VTISKRVSEERGCELGTEVGYAVRFDDCSTQHTKLRYMTDGMLLREAISDPLLTRYNTVILDEAHERTVHTDILFGVVKLAQKRRKESDKVRDLKIIVMSATLDPQEYSKYFNNARVVYIEGRQYPVEVFYTTVPQSDYLHSAIVTVLQIHQNLEKEEGDILVFLTGQEEIESMCGILKQCSKLLPEGCLDLQVCTLFAALPTEQQRMVFQPTSKGCRKVILSTNIAETSVTIPGVKYVVDTGMIKAKGYNPLIGLDVLCVQPVSQAQAWQRCGRAGREGPGACYRLYTEDSFQSLPPKTVPEIQRCDLSSVVLQLLALGVSDIVGFEFMDQPPPDSLVNALEQLHLLGAVGRKKKLQLSQLGVEMARLPLHPQLAKVLLKSKEYKCSEEILSIVAMLSVESVVYTPNDKRDHALSVRAKFTSPEGDHLMLLNLFRMYKSAKGNKDWCRENYINIRNMATVTDIRKQLRELCVRLNIPLVSTKNTDDVLKCLLCGLFTNTAQYIGEGKYKSVSTHQEIFIHPSSCLFHIKPPPPLVFYSDLIQTAKRYMRNVSMVDMDALFEVAPDYFKRPPSAHHTGHTS
jgi:ATP-dependent RNA helicase DHX33